MSEKLKDFIKRCLHPQTLLAIVGAIGVIGAQMGYTVDTAGMTKVVTAISTVLIALGVLNDTKTAGSYIPFVTKPINVIPEAIDTKGETVGISIETMPGSEEVSRAARPSSDIVELTDADIEKAEHNAKLQGLTVENHISKEE